MLKNIYNYFLYYSYRIHISTKFLIKHQKNKKMKIVCFLIRNYLQKKYNIIFSKDSIIGENFNFPHPHNIVIGRNAKIGNNCTIYHDVTLGQNHDKYPILGNNVIVYAGAKIIGDVHIGNNAIIGANAVVTKDVPDNAIAAGIPARVIKYRSGEDDLY